MNTPAPRGVTDLLVDWTDGDKAALDQLMPIVYDELRRLAERYLARERRDHTLQATALGYHAHGMTGIEFDRAREELGVPDDFRLEAAVAIGRQAPADRLPEELREREVPSGRKPVGEVAIAGSFR